MHEREAYGENAEEVVLGSGAAAVEDPPELHLVAASTITSQERVIDTDGGWDDISVAGSSLSNPGEEFRRHRTFITEGARTALRMDRVSRTIRGPFHASFNAILRQCDEDLRRIGPELPAELLGAGGVYWSPQTGRLYDNLATDQRDAIHAVRVDRRRRIHELTNDVLGPALQRQTIAPDVLDVPPYLPQGGEGRSEVLCTNACFRMIFEGITGWRMSEGVVSHYMTNVYGRIVLADEEYFKLFKTPHFRQISDRYIQTIEILGGDFRSISTLATRMKEQYAEAQVYAMVNFQGAQAEGNVWHTAILLNVGTNKVVLHDPSRTGAAYCEIDKGEFIRRWAIAYNRTSLILAV